MHITPINHIANGYFRNTSNIGKRKFTDAEKIEQYYNIRNGMTKRAFITHYNVNQTRYSDLNSHRNEPELYERVQASFDAGKSEGDALADIVAWKDDRTLQNKWTLAGDRLIWDMLQDDRSSSEIMDAYVEKFGTVGKGAMYVRISNYRTGNGSNSVKGRITKFKSTP